MRRRTAFRRRRCAGLVLGLALAVLAALPLAVPPDRALAQTGAEQAAGAEPPPVLLQADKVTHDEANGVLTASGNVELVRANRTLRADRVRYDQRENTVTATGGVMLLEPSGEVLFADRMELTGDMKTGFISNLRGLLNDGSRFAAVSGQRIDGERKVMRRAVFSPCQLCKDDPDGDPLWQIKAFEVVHDEASRDIEYKNAFLELFGIPVLYMPYFLHPDPTVDRRTGMLAPTLGRSDELGTIIGLPTYIAIDGSRGLEVEPILYSREGTILRSVYQQRFARGEIELAGTAAYIENREGDHTTGSRGLEGSADMSGTFHLDERWRAGFDWEQASTRTYLRRFGLSEKQILTSRLYAEGFRGRDYVNVSAYKFQGLRAGDDRARSPTVAPIAEASLIGEPSGLGGRWEVNANLMSLTRTRGVDSRRLSLRSGWQMPWYGPAGDVYNLAAMVQTDAYYTGGFATSRLAETDEALTTRLVPQLGLNWRFPFYRHTTGLGQLVEPVVNLVLAPNGGNPDEIPNEDSQAFEFDDTNLFSLNRFEGVDRVTSGSRLDFGVNLGLFGEGGGTGGLFIGRSYRFAGASAFDEGSGLRGELSDFVGRIHVAPTDAIDLLYRFRADKEDYELSRNDFGVRVNLGKVGLYADYVALDEERDTNVFGDREQLDLAASARVSDEWSLTGRLVQNLAHGQNTTLLAGMGLHYLDECITVSLNFERRELRDADIQPEDRIFLRVNFKYLGGADFSGGTGP